MQGCNYCAVIPDFCPVIPAKAGIQRVGDVVRAGVGRQLVHPRRADRAGYAHRNPDGVAVVSGVTTTTSLGERASANSKTSPPASAAATPTASATLSPKFNLALAVDMASPPPSLACSPIDLIPSRLANRPTCGARNQADLSNRTPIVARVSVLRQNPAGIDRVHGRAAAVDRRAEYVDNLCREEMI